MCIMVQMEGDGGDRGDNALGFQCVHSDNDETHQDACACFTNVGLIVAAACNKGGMTRLVAFALTLDGVTRQGGSAAPSSALTARMRDGGNPTTNSVVDRLNLLVYFAEEEWHCESLH